MNATLDALTADGRVVITFLESAVPTQERENRFTEKAAKALADEVDSDWWGKSRERILRSIGEA